MLCFAKVHEGIERIFLEKVQRAGTRIERIAKGNVSFGDSYQSSTTRVVEVAEARLKLAQPRSGQWWLDATIARKLPTLAGRSVGLIGK
jgi:hypothetical protein